mmetsp:Transcript_14648/g.21787  ORF Transcript_14648/g.21787 Transcript_14648/m.21787 type:complete len:229 (-) Transcript_14648:772-1458(-)
MGLHPHPLRPHVRQEVRYRRGQDDEAPLGQQLLRRQGQEVEEERERRGRPHPRPRFLPVLHEPHPADLQRRHGRRRREAHHHARQDGTQAHHRGEGPPPEEAHEVRHAEVPPRRRRPARDADSPLAFPTQGPEVPCRDPLRGTLGRRVRCCHPRVQPRRTPDALHLQDGAHRRRRPLLRLRPRLLRNRQDRAEGPHHGTQLRAGQEGGLVPQDHPAHHSHDGQVHRAH